MASLTVRLTRRIQELEESRAIVMARTAMELRTLDTALARLRALRDAMPGGLDETVATLKEVGLVKESE